MSNDICCCRKHMGVGNGLCPHCSVHPNEPPHEHTWRYAITTNLDGDLTEAKAEECWIWVKCQGCSAAFQTNLSYEGEIPNRFVNGSLGI